MKKIAEYTVLQGKSNDQLERMVNNAIKEGWQPYGFPSVVRGNDGRLYYCQALVLYKNKK